MNKRFTFKASILTIGLLATTYFCTFMHAEQTTFTNSGIEKKIIEKVITFVAATFDEKTSEKNIKDCLAAIFLGSQPMATDMLKELFDQESCEFIEKIISLKKEMSQRFIDQLETIIIKKGNHQTSETANKFEKSINNFTQILDYYLYETIYYYAQEHNIEVDSFSMQLPVDKETQDAIDQVIETFISTNPGPEEVKSTLIALGIMNIVQERHPEIASTDQTDMQYIQEKTAGTMKSLQELGKNGNKKIQGAIQAIIMGQMNSMLKGENLNANSPQEQQMAMMLMAAATMQTMQHAYKAMYNKLEKSHKLITITFDIDGKTMNLPTPNSIDKKDLPKPEKLAEKLKPITKIIEL
jgi:hypothetical protein